MQQRAFENHFVGGCRFGAAAWLITHLPRLREPLTPPPTEGEEVMAIGAAA